MKIGDTYSENNIYRGIKHSNNLPLLAEDLHEFSDTLSEKNKYLLDSILGSGIINDITPVLTETGVSLASPAILNIEGDICLAYNSPNIDLADYDTVKSFSSGTICLVGWYQNITSSTTMREYGGVMNDTLPNNLIYDPLNIQVSSRYQFRWDTSVIEGTISPNYSIPLDLRDANGDLTVGSTNITPYFSKEGNCILIENLPSQVDLSVTQYGQCVQDGTPTPQAPAPITGKAAGGSAAGKNMFLNFCANKTYALGSTVTVNPDGSIAIHKVAGEIINQNTAVSFSPGTYVVSSGTTETLAYIEARGLNNGVVASINTSAAGRTRAFNGGITRLFLFSPSAAAGDVTIYPQLELGSIATPYEPYKVIQTQTVTDTNGDPVTLYGLPVATGGNVTIDGQQYVADTLEGATLTRRVGCVDLGTLTWAYNDGIQANSADVPLAKRGESYVAIANLVCDAFAPSSIKNVENSHSADNIITIHNAAPRIEVYCTAYTDAAAFKAAMSGVMLYYELANLTTETVTLSPAALAANAPTTTFLSEAYSSVCYSTGYTSGSIYRADSPDSIDYTKDGLYVVPLIEYSYDYIRDEFTRLASYPVRKINREFITSNTEPIGSHVTGSIWYNPINSEFHTYIEGEGFISNTPSLGFVQYNYQNIEVSDNYMTTPQNITYTIPSTDIPDFLDSDLIRVTYEGLELVPSVDYTIDRTNKQITLLNFTRIRGEKLLVTSTRLVEANDVTSLTGSLTTHMSTEGNSSVIGHLKLSDAIDSSYNSSNGVAATPKAVKDSRILTDTVTGIRYNLSVTNGEIVLVEVNT